MEKLFKIEISENDLLFGAVGDATLTKIGTTAVIPSWDLKDKTWMWLIRRTSDREIVLELYKDGTVEYNSRPIVIGRNGTGLVVASGKHYVRALDSSVVEFMFNHKIQCLDKYPEIESEFKNGATLQRKVYTIDHQQVKAVAGSFLLDHEKPFLVDTIRVKGSNRSIIHGICIPAGFKFDTKKSVPMSTKKSVTEIHRSEVHTFSTENPENPENIVDSIPTNHGATIGEIVGAELDALAIEVKG